MCRKKVICRVRVEIDLLPSVTKLRRLCFYTCLSFCPRGGVCLSACWDTTPLGGGRHSSPRPGTPRSRYPPRSRLPRTRHPPEAGTPYTRQPLEAGTPPPPRRLLLRTVRILLECILVFEEFLQSTKTRNNPSIDYDG